MCKVIDVAGEGKTYSKRSASVYEAAPGRFVLQVSVWDKRGFCKTTFYDLSALPAPAWGRSAWRLVKAEARAERAVYDVLLSDSEAQESCTCPHGTYKPNGEPCVHRASLRALIARGKLPAPKPAPKVVHVPAALDGKPTTVPATVDPGYATDDDNAVCWAPDDVVGLAPARAARKRGKAPAAVAPVGPSVTWDDL